MISGEAAYVPRYIRGTAAPETKNEMRQSL